MPVATSYERLRAKIEAWPFKAQAAFQTPLLELVRGASKTELLEDMRPWAGGRSEEVLFQLAEATWFSGLPSSSSRLQLGRYLEMLAARYLAPGGGRFCLRAGDPREGVHADGKAAKSYRWLTLLLPPDLLVAARCAQQAVAPRSEVISLGSPGVRSVLAEPVAQTHLHVGAALPFSELWTAMMLEVADAPLSRARRMPRVGRFFDSEPELRLRLAQAAIARITFGEYLREVGADMRTTTQSSFDSFIQRWVQRLPRGGSSSAEFGVLVRQAVAFAPADMARTRRLCACLAAPVALRRRRIATPADLRGADPVHAILSEGNVVSEVCPETELCYRALRFLAARPQPDSAFVASFWQYQRVRCSVYGLIVEEPGTSGMDWFLRHYRGMSTLRGRAEKVVVAMGLENDNRDANLRSFEVRTSPCETASETVSLVREFTRQFESVVKRQEQRIEFGIVFHFIKTNDHSERELRFGRYSRWFQEQLRRATAFATTFERNPEMLVLLRGLDACTLELAVPNWPFVRLFERVREASRRAADTLSRRRPEWEVRPIRATFHAGEEYRSLHDGLRRMHELVEFGILTRGDRVGHGLALGEDAERWSRTAQSVAQPREERLDDLLWELDRTAAGDLPTHSTRHAFVSDHALALGKDLYGSCDLDELRAARRLRHDPRIVCDELGYPFTRRPATPANRERALLHRYLTDPYVWRRGREPVEVPTDAAQASMLHVAQEWVRSVYAGLEITVESNPSSNLVVGDYGSLEEHPVLRLSPVTNTGTLRPSCLRVSINTDDPAIVTTSLGDEYAHQYYALLGLGVSSKDALTWLDAARRAGWDSRFTLPSSADSPTLAEIGARKRPL